MEQEYRPQKPLIEKPPNENIPTGQRESYLPPASYNPFGHGYPSRHATTQPRSWARKSTRSERVKYYLKTNTSVIALGIILAAIIVGIIVFVVQFTSSSSNAPVVVNQPATASQVATQLNCKSFKDLGPAAGGGVADSGSCTINGTKYAINTFANQDARDSWIKMSASFGVVPKWETTTSVTYKSVTK